MRTFTIQAFTATAVAIVLTGAAPNPDGGAVPEAQQEQIRNILLDCHVIGAPPKPKQVTEFAETAGIAESDLIQLLTSWASVDSTDLKGADALVVQISIETLGSIESEASREVLFQLASTKTGNLRRTALAGLVSAHGSGEVPEKVTKLITSDDDDLVRRAAYEALIRRSDKLETNSLMHASSVSQLQQLFSAEQDDGTPYPSRSLSRQEVPGSCKRRGTQHLAGIASQQPDEGVSILR